MNACLPRTRDNLLAIVALENVETNPVYQKDFGGKGWTHCNSFVHFVTKRLECPVPLLLANQQFIWLGGVDGKAAGWSRVDAKMARQWAEEGRPVVAAWFNQFGHGHIALCVPSGPGEGLHVASAGAHNFESAPVSKSFGNVEPQYFRHP